jgi:hypothetical protein
MTAKMNSESLREAGYGAQNKKVLRCFSQRQFWTEPALLSLKRRAGRLLRPLSALL